MKRHHLLALLAAGLVVVSGCADKGDAIPGIRITPSIKTRVTGLHFDTGDCIGLTVTKNGSDYVRNRQMTYDGSAFAASGLLWYNDQSEASTLTAYFPYSASGVPDEFSVAQDQTAGCASSDLLGAVAKNVTPSGTPVGMLFYHLMSQLTIVVTNSSDAAISGVTLSGFVPAASVDLSVPTAAAKAGAAAAAIKAFEVTPDASYRAILVPQQGALTVTILTSDGKSRSKTLSSARLESGRRYDMSVLVTNIDIELKLSGRSATGPTAVRSTRATAGRLPHWNTAVIPTARPESADGCGWPRTCAIGLRARRSARGYGIPRRDFPRWRKRGFSTITRRRRAVPRSAPGLRCGASVPRAGTSPHWPNSNPSSL